LRPDLYVLRLARAFVVAHHDPAHAPGSGRRRPDDVGIGRVGCRPAALTTSHRMPLTTRDGPSSTAAPPPEPADLRIRRPARPGPVLAVRHHVIRNVVVHGAVIHPRDGALHAVPRLAAIAGVRGL